MAIRVRLAGTNQVRKEVLVEAYIHLSSARLHLIYVARQADVLQSQITFLVGLPKSMMLGKFWLNPR